MPYSTSQMNEYMKKRWRRRRKEAIKKLGGRCIQCGSTRLLEFDHTDQKTKAFTISGCGRFFERFAMYMGHKQFCKIQGP